MIKNYLHFFNYIYHTRMLNILHWTKEKLQVATSNFYITEAHFPGQMLLAGWTAVLTDEQPCSRTGAQWERKGRWGRAQRRAQDSPGPSSLPQKVNFTRRRALDQEESQNCSRAHMVVLVDFKTTQGWRRWKLTVVPRKCGKLKRKHQQTVV